MWIQVGIIVLILKQGAASSTIFNTTTCFDAGKGAYSIECKKNGSETSLDIIAIRNVYYGTKLKNPSCNPDACCLPNTKSDCIYRKNDKMKDIIRTCSGNAYCVAETDQLFNFANCKNAHKYSLFTTYALLEYECINIQKLVNMFDAGTTKRDTSLYLTSNIFHKNGQRVNTTCSCVVTTNCNSTIQILAVDIRLASDCYEKLVITDGNTTKHVTCQDSGLHSFQPLFISNSNIVNIDLNIRDEHNGMVWIQVQGRDEDSEIEVRCGDNTQLPINDNHMCEKSTTESPSSTSSSPTTTISPPGSASISPTTTISPPGSASISPTTTISPSSSTSISPTTTICTDCYQSQQDKQAGLSGGIIGGVSTAVIIIILVMIIILVLVFRSRKSEHNGSNENIYNSSIEEDNQYETRASPAGQATGDAASATNPAYYNGKESQHPDEHPYDNKTNEHPYDIKTNEHPYDNKTNEHLNDNKPNDNGMNTQDIADYVYLS